MGLSMSQGISSSLFRKRTRRDDVMRFESCFDCALGLCFKCTVMAQQSFWDKGICDSWINCLDIQTGVQKMKKRVRCRSLHRLCQYTVYSNVKTALPSQVVTPRRASSSIVQRWWQRGPGSQCNPASLSQIMLLEHDPDDPLLSLRLLRV